MAYHLFTLGGTHLEGYRVDEDGTVRDFAGNLRNHYQNIVTASQAARRKYRDPTITVTSMKQRKERYRVDLDKLLTIAERIS